MPSTSARRAMSAAPLHGLACPESWRCMPSSRTSCARREYSSGSISIVADLRAQARDGAVSRAAGAAAAGRALLPQRELDPMQAGEVGRADRRPQARGRPLMAASSRRTRRRRRRSTRSARRPSATPRARAGQVAARDRGAQAGRPRRASRRARAARSAGIASALGSRRASRAGPPAPCARRRRAARAGWRRGRAAAAAAGERHRRGSRDARAPHPQHPCRTLPSVSSGSAA